MKPSDVCAAPLEESGHEGTSELTRLERTVVRLSRLDGLISVEQSGRFKRFLVEFFGVRFANRLANARLEALRRYCVVSRIIRGQPPFDEAFILRNGGFSEAALREIEALIREAAARGGRRF
jgi:hypothetical protein